MFSKKFCPEVWAMSEFFYSAKYSLKIFCRIAMTAVVVFQLDEPKIPHNSSTSSAMNARLNYKRPTPLFPLPLPSPIIFMRLFPRAGAIQE